MGMARVDSKPKEVPSKNVHADSISISLTLEALGGGGGGVQLTPRPSIFLALYFCSLTDCQKHWHNCSLFVNTSFDTN